MEQSFMCKANTHEGDPIRSLKVIEWEGISDQLQSIQLYLLE